MDAKATVKVGPFARGGKSRVPTVAADPDFHPDATVTPVGISLPALDELFLYGITSKVTSDCLVNCLMRWWEVVRDGLPTLLPASSTWIIPRRTIVDGHNSCGASWILPTIPA